MSSHRLVSCSCHGLVPKAPPTSTRLPKIFVSDSGTFTNFQSPTTTRTTLPLLSKLTDCRHRPHLNIVKYQFLKLHRYRIEATAHCLSVRPRFHLHLEPSACFCPTRNASGDEPSRRAAYEWLVPAKRRLSSCGRENPREGSGAEVLRSADPIPSRADPNKKLEQQCEATHEMQLMVNVQVKIGENLVCKNVKETRRL